MPSALGTDLARLAVDGAHIVVAGTDRRAVLRGVNRFGPRVRRVQGTGGRGSRGRERLDPSSRPHPSDPDRGRRRVEVPRGGGHHSRRDSRDRHGLGRERHSCAVHAGLRAPRPQRLAGRSLSARHRSRRRRGRPNAARTRCSICSGSTRTRRAAAARTAASISCRRCPMSRRSTCGGRSPHGIGGEPAVLFDLFNEPHHPLFDDVEPLVGVCARRSARPAALTQGRHGRVAALGPAARAAGARHPSTGPALRVGRGLGLRSAWFSDSRSQRLAGRGARLQHRTSILGAARTLSRGPARPVRGRERSVICRRGRRSSRASGAVRRAMSRGAGGCCGTLEDRSIGWTAWSWADWPPLVADCRRCDYAPTIFRRDRARCVEGTDGCFQGAPDLKVRLTGRSGLPEGPAYRRGSPWLHASSSEVRAVEEGASIERRQTMRRAPSGCEPTRCIIHRPGVVPRTSVPTVT